MRDRRAAAPGGTLVFYSADYDLAGEQFDTLRKARWTADSLVARPIPGVKPVAPEPLVAEDIQKVHAPEYVAAVRTGEPRGLAASNGLSWDPGLWNAVCASNGGAVAAARFAFSRRLNAGSLSSGLHHARQDHGYGFCTFNGLALAARAVLDAGATHILILDLDAHCGGGTYSLVSNWPEVVQVDIAVCGVDCYSPSPDGRSSLDIVRHAGDYLPKLRARLAGVEDIDFDVLIYNAGMDPHEHCRIGGLAGMTKELLAERERTVFDWARRVGVGVAFVLAGGYEGGALTRAALIDLHRLTIEEAAAGGSIRGQYES